jgi:hypothetical protein
MGQVVCDNEDDDSNCRFFDVWITFPYDVKGDRCNQGKEVWEELRELHSSKYANPIVPGKDAINFSEIDMIGSQTFSRISNPWPRLKSAGGAISLLAFNGNSPKLHLCADYTSLSRKNLDFCPKTHCTLECLSAVLKCRQDQPSIFLQAGLTRLNRVWIRPDLRASVYRHFGRDVIVQNSKKEVVCWMHKVTEGNEESPALCTRFVLGRFD